MLRYYAFLAAVVLLGLAIALLRPSPALSDTDLTSLVAATFLPRTEDPRTPTLLLPNTAVGH